MLTYAAATPTSLDATDRQNYATFLQYAAGAGQVSGVEVGQLPPGYVPLPSALQSQALSAAATILNPPTPSTPTPGTVTSPTTPSASTTVAPTTSPVVTISPGGLPTAAPTPLSSTATSPSTAPTAVAVTSSDPPPVQANAALSTVRTGEFGLGALRWALPIALLSAAGAAALSALLSPGRRRRGRPGGAPEQAPVRPGPW